jgi:hypothetical protein
MQLEHERLSKEKFELENRVSLGKSYGETLFGSTSGKEDSYTMRNLSAAVRLLPRFDEADVESYLRAFERVVELHRFPKDQWASLLHTQLTGKGLMVFSQLTFEECSDYITLRAALLKAYAVTAEVYRRRFRDSKRHQDETYSEFAFRLNIPFQRWMESEKAYEDLNRMLEVIKLEQFYKDLPADLKEWLLDRKPQTLANAAQFADEYNATHLKPSWRDSRVRDSANQDMGFRKVQRANYQPLESERTTSWRSAPSRLQENRAFPKFGQALGRTFPRLTCTFCHKQGHDAGHCFQLKQVRDTQREEKKSKEQFDTKRVSLVQNGSNFKFAEIDPLYTAYCSKGIVKGTDGRLRNVVCLRDSGALQTLVSKSMFDHQAYVETGERRFIRGVTGEAVAIPLVEVELNSKFGNSKVLCGLVDELPSGIHVLIGNDCDPVSPTDEEILPELVVTRSQKTKAIEELEVETPSTEPSESPTEETEDWNLASLFDQDDEDIELTTVDIRELKRLQKEDEELQKLEQLMVSTNGESRKTSYFTENDILLRRYFAKEVPQEDDLGTTQIVVPKKLRMKLLKLAHDIPAAGHLGMSKTKNRLLRNFFWPSIDRDVRYYVKTCDMCQKLGKGFHRTTAPLVSLPIFDEPFERVAIDIVGPLPECRESGNRFLLTMMDLCTHFPDAVPLKNHDAVSVAKGLVSVFSRFGFPKEILSDRGTEFMSEVFQLFTDQCGISHIRASPYHPQTNSSCERFHRTLKSMMRSVRDKFPDNWDECILWLLFSYREVPVEGLGFSPFDLMFGREVMGPLTVLKEDWLAKDDILPKVKKKSAINFLLELRNKIRCSVESANEAQLKLQKKFKRLHDRHAKQKEYTEGDQVLVLLPIEGRPLEVKYFGPYKILRRVGTVDYILETPDRRKNSQLCHVNLLKPYFCRDEERIALLVLPEDAKDVERRKSVTFPQQLEKHMENLPEERSVDLLKLLNEYEDIFQELPGRTNLIKHQIQLETGTKPSHSLPYRLDPQKQAFVKQEIEDLLKQGIIEESSSAWSAPVVVVSKSDGNFRLCIDYRKLNTNTTSDPYPMPHIENLIDQIGDSEFLTKLDLTKGYWQVPMDEECVDKTGFVTSAGHFQWKVMPFGLKNSPATFNRLMAKVLRGFSEFATSYLDDIIIFSRTWEEHLSHIRQVLERIRNANLTLKLSKCEFGDAEVDFLGHHIGKGKIQPREVKIQAIEEFPRPANKKQLQSFLGLIGYYRRFIPHFSQVSAVLTDLLRKDRHFVWTEMMEKVFLDLKSRMSTRPILRMPDFKKPFGMSIDASDSGIGAVLFQIHEGTEHPVLLQQEVV